ncbi:MAG: FkbM family methyltransferase [Oscillospiraceae bacterium]|nr:FkbM family methyltransferase [Oscillospiraceae bacterium]
MLTKKEWEYTCFGGAGQEKHSLPVQIDSNCRLVIYGAGYCGLMFLELLRSRGIEPECFLDMSPQKQGRKIMGVCVHEPNRVWVEDATVVVCLLKMEDTYQQIKARLMEMGCHSIFHLYELREDRTLFQNQPLLISPNRELIWNNKDFLYQVCEMLEDECSRQTLSSILRFLWCDLYEHIPSFPMEDQYFANDIYSLGENEVFADCGAHVGEIFRQFSRRCQGRFASYWVFEPDKQNVYMLEDACPREFRQRMMIQHVALGEQAGTVRIRNYDGSNSVIREDGEDEASCTTLDSFAAQLHPTILKIDVEGWESRLLTGAQEIICRDKPLIAIAVYHREQDFWEIPLRLKQWVPEYRLYLRSYLSVAETVLYAVPPGRTKQKESKL